LCVVVKVVSSACLCLCVLCSRRSPTSIQSKSRTQNSHLHSIQVTNLLVVAAMVLMEHDAFLDALTKMYGQTREKGSVNVSMKQARDEKDGVERCLVRAHSGNNNKKGKISTKVHTFAIARSNAAPQ
jgi:hypothetical protein